MGAPPAATFAFERGRAERYGSSVSNTRLDASVGGDDHSHDEVEQAREEQRREANAMLGMGASIGAIGALSALAVGAVCPVCVIATPALLGVGLYKRIKLRKAKA
jgi:hypothetical protein